MTFAELKDILDGCEAGLLNQDVTYRDVDEYSIILATTFDKRLFFTSEQESDDGQQNNAS